VPFRAGARSRSHERRAWRREQFREAISARGDSAPSRLGLANALLAQKKFEAGTDALGEYLKLNPGDRAERFERASALMEIDRYDDALAELDRAEPVPRPLPKDSRCEATLSTPGKMEGSQ